MLKSVSKVCRVIKWYPPREMTSPNDKTNGRECDYTLPFNSTEREAMKP